MNLLRVLSGLFRLFLIYDYFIGVHTLRFREIRLIK